MNHNIALGYMNAWPRVKRAIEFVAENHHGVTQVLFDSELRWLFLTADFKAPEFDSNMDVSLLESAVDAVYDNGMVPFIFSIDSSWIMTDEGLTYADDSKNIGLNETIEVTARLRSIVDTDNYRLIFGANKKIYLYDTSENLLEEAGGLIASEALRVIDTVERLVGLPFLI